MNVRRSTTPIGEDLTNKDLDSQWNTIPLEIAQEHVNRLQTRIAKAVKEGKYRLARRLQYLLTHSFYAKVLAVRKVTTNRGKRTAGIDGVIWYSKSDKMRAVYNLRDKHYRSTPLKRIYIPKPNSEKFRPLSLPTMHDRAMQALYAMALEPWAETTGDKRSFGFRKGRSTHDACEYVFSCLSRKDSPCIVLEGDIRGCFDWISHQWLIEHIPMDKSILRQFLKSGFVEFEMINSTTSGTPQGGLISPILANMTLDGIEPLLMGKYKRVKVNYTRYADDFVVTAKSREIALQVKEDITQFLSERGLELSDEKTKITDINEGFDFLGWTFRKYHGKLLVKPSLRSVSAITERISKIVNSAKSWNQNRLLETLNPVIEGWARYHRFIVASKTFARLDFVVWEMLWKWALRRHPNKGKDWVAHRYWEHNFHAKWTFGTDDGTLKRFSKFKIVRYPRLKLDQNPYLEPCYFKKRKQAIWVICNHDKVKNHRSSLTTPV